MNEYSKPQKLVAQDILRELQDQYRDVKANDACILFCRLRDYITKTYLSEEEQE